VLKKAALEAAFFVIGWRILQQSSRKAGGDVAAAAITRE
jgi:hypothetical protein